MQGTLHAREGFGTIMFYQSALNLHKTLNVDKLSLENVTVLNQMTHTSRQINFEILRENLSKIGMNTFANNFTDKSCKK